MIISVNLLCQNSNSVIQRNGIIKSESHHCNKSLRGERKNKRWEEQNPTLSCWWQPCDDANTLTHTCLFFLNALSVLFFLQHCQTPLEYMEYIFFFSALAADDRTWAWNVKDFQSPLFWLHLLRSLIVIGRTNGGVVRFRTINERFEVEVVWITESIFAVGFSTAPEAMCQKGFWSNKLRLLYIFSHYPEGKSVQSTSWECIALACDIWWGAVHVCQLVCSHLADWGEKS